MSRRANHPKPSCPSVDAAVIEGQVVSALLEEFPAGMSSAQKQNRKERPMKGTYATILGTVICLAALAAWAFTIPASGSGWILFIAFLATLGFLQSIRDSNLASIAGVIITVVAALTWYFNRQADHAGWVLALSIFSGLATSVNLGELVSSATQPQKLPKKKKK
jgi:hypothetical protein